VNNSAYATKAVDVNGVSPDAEPASAGGIWDALESTLHLTIPDDLVVKGSDLRSSSGPGWARSTSRWAAT
jgi:hypothetical protein